MQKMRRIILFFFAGLQVGLIVLKFRRICQHVSLLRSFLSVQKCGSFGTTIMLLFLHNDFHRLFKQFILSLSDSLDGGVYFYVWHDTNTLCFFPIGVVYSNSRNHGS